MRWFIAILVLAAALVAVLVFVPVKQGQPLLDRGELSVQLERAGLTGWLSAGDETVSEGAAALEVPVTRQVYRWQNAAGQWQFGDTPPPGVQAEPVGVKELKTLNSDQIRRSDLNP